MENTSLGKLNQSVQINQKAPHFDAISRPQSRVKQIWAIGGGKGGVGKSLISSSLAISLSRLGHQVTAIDLDLGGANLHTALGAPIHQQTLGDFLLERTPSLESCSVESGIPNLKLISGAQDSTQLISSPLKSFRKVIDQLHALDTDYVVLDLGAGTAPHTIEFFLSADIGLLTVLPEPTSIENIYRFVKSIYYETLLNTPSLSSVRGMIEAATDPKNTKKIQTPGDLYRQINKVDPEAASAMRQEVQAFHPKLIVNQARTQADVDIGFSIKSVCKKYFGIEMDYVGYLDYDSAVWQAIRRKRPMMLEFPNSRLVGNIDRMTQHLIKMHSKDRSLRQA